MMTRLSDLIGNLARPRVLVVGDLMLDRYVRGSVNRISPEAPIQILKVVSRTDAPGGAANVAFNAAALDLPVTCLGVTGNDEPARALTALLRKKHIRPLLIRDAGRRTTVKSRMTAHHQQMLRVDEEVNEPLSAATERRLIGLLKRISRNGVDIVVVSDYDKGTMTPSVCRVVADLCRKAKIPLIVGLKMKDAAKYRGATAVALNRAELALVSGIDHVDRGAKKVIRALDLQFLIVTLGEKGIVVRHRDGRSFAVAARAKEVFDVTGAGDTVIAVFSALHAAGVGVSDAIHLANTAAGIVVGKRGTETVSREELASAVREEGAGSHAKIVPLDRLARSVAGERARGNKIVFTNGCFDLLHPGHIETLRFAKSQGDILIVGLNSDRSVRRLKGPDRPITDQTGRAKILAALEDVDYVVIFDEETPLHLIRRIRPDVLVKGADWRTGGVVGRDVVESCGGRVVFAPLVRGRSTTQLVKAIRHKQI